MAAMWAWDGAADGPFTMIWSLLVSLLASFAAREVVNGQAPSGRECQLECMGWRWGADRVFVVAPKKFLSIPLGNVKPSGWLHDQVCSD